MSTIRLDRESPEPHLWAKRLASCGRSNCFQSWSWGAATRQLGEASVHRAYIEKNGRPVGLVQVFEEKRLGLFTLGKVVRGPLFFHPVLPEDRIAAITAISKLYPLGKLKRFSILPELPDGPASRGLMAQNGFHIAMEGYETAWLDLTHPLDSLWAGLRQNFRNQIRKAQRESLSVNIVEDPRPLLTLYEAHKRQARYHGPSSAMLSALPEEEVICLEVRQEEKLLAGLLFILHGRSATYQVGWTGDEGRLLHAHNLLLWHGIEILHGRGIRYFDLGGLNWTQAPGIAHFKAGLGAEPYCMPGTYV